MTQQLQSVEGVTSVESLADGPKNFEDAEKSPFWKRLLIAENGRSSNVVIFALSNFPPTQRFGLVVVSGTVIDILANLFVLPLLGGAEWKTWHTAAS